MDTTLSKFYLEGKVSIITGGAGLLGGQHAAAISEAGGFPILWDINGKAVVERADEITVKLGVECQGMKVDITDQDAVSKGMSDILKTHKQVDILINNAANDPKLGGEGMSSSQWSRLENFPLEVWNQDIAVGLTGAFLCSQVIGSEMARQGRGVILNIASDLSVIAPDQRLYRKGGLPDDQQPVKPVTYSVIKSGLVGLTRYLATYWADKGVRVNALSPGGVYTDQPQEFVQRLTNLIPLGRMAARDEYRGAVQFLCSDASKYMTGQNVVMDGGRSCW